MSEVSTLTVHNPAGGQLPEGWRVGPLNEFCEMYQPKTISTKELIDHGEFPVYGANGQIGFYDQFNHADSEVTVTCRGATCGTVNVIPARSWITGNAMVVRPLHGSVSRPFLAYELQSIDMTAVITGTAQPQITRTTLAPMSITVPPLAEQERIVEILEEQLSRLDAALESVRVVREKVRSLEISTIHNSVVKNCQHYELVDFEDALVLQRGFDLPVQDRQSGDYPILAASGVIDTHNESKVGGPGVVTGRSGSIGIVQYVEDSFWPLNTTLYVKDFNGNHPRFIYYLLQTVQLKKFAGGSTVPSLDRKVLREVKFRIPPIDEQIQVADFLDETISRIREGISRADAIEKRSAALRRSLLHAAFTGRLTEKWRESVHV